MCMPKKRKKRIRMKVRCLNETKANTVKNTKINAIIKERKNVEEYSEHSN